MKIIVDRSSVCSGDDMSSHAKEFVIPEDMPYSAFMELIIQSGYFPNISGNDVVWVLENKNEELLSYITKPNRIFTRWFECDPLVSETVNYSSDNMFFFRYYSSPLKMAEYIYTEHFGDLSFMQPEGFYFEYMFYNVSKDIERQWKKRIAR